RPSRARVVGDRAGRAPDVRERGDRVAPSPRRDAVAGDPRRRPSRRTDLPRGGAVIMLRQLVVNADDLGLTVGVNDGILDAHELGILTSASLFASAPATADAIRRTRIHRSLGVGAHLALVDGTPTLPARLVPVAPPWGRGEGRARAGGRRFGVAGVGGGVAGAGGGRGPGAERGGGAAGATPLPPLAPQKPVPLPPPIFSIVARLAVRFG